MIVPTASLETTLIFFFWVRVCVCKLLFCPKYAGPLSLHLYLCLRCIGLSVHTPTTTYDHFATSHWLSLVALCHPFIPKLSLSPDHHFRLSSRKNNAYFIIIIRHTSRRLPLFALCLSLQHP